MYDSMILLIHSEVNSAVVQGALLLMELAADSHTIHVTRRMQMLWVREASIQISMKVFEAR